MPPPPQKAKIILQKRSKEFRSTKPRDLGRSLVKVREVQARRHSGDQAQGTDPRTGQQSGSGGSLWRCGQVGGPAMAGLLEKAVGSPSLQLAVAQGGGF